MIDKEIQALADEALRISDEKNISMALAIVEVADLNGIEPSVIANKLNERKARKKVRSKNFQGWFENLDVEYEIRKQKPKPKQKKNPEPDIFG